MSHSEHGNLRIEWCGPPHMKPDDAVAEYLRERGYLVLSPSDTSPVAELVRAACMPSGPTVFTHQEYDGRLHNMGMEAAKDPAVRAWFERGRK